MSFSTTSLSSPLTSHQQSVNNEQVNLKISQSVVVEEDSRSIFILSSGVYPLIDPIRHYHHHSIDRAMNSTSTATGIIFRTTITISFITLSNSFAKLLRLAQYIEIIMLLNVKSPVNLSNFLSYFSQDIFGLLFNPFKKIESSPRCRLDHKLLEQLESCLFLVNTGDLFFFFCLLVALKAASYRMKRCSNFFKTLDGLINLSWYCMVIDGIFFDLLLPATVNIYKRTTGDRAGFASFLFSVFVSFGMVCHCLLAFIHCKYRDLPPSRPRLRSFFDSYMTYLPTSTDIGFFRDAAIDSKLLIGKYYRLLNCLKMLLYLVPVVFLQSRPLYQVLSAASIALLYSLLLTFRLKVFKQKDDRVKEAVMSWLVAISMSLIVGLTEEAEAILSPALQYYCIGGSLIVLIALILLFSIIEALRDCCRQLKSFDHFLRSKSKVKVSDRMVKKSTPVSKSLYFKRSSQPIERRIELSEKVQASSTSRSFLQRISHHSKNSPRPSTIRRLPRGRLCGPSKLTSNKSEDKTQ